MDADIIPRDDPSVLVGASRPPAAGLCQTISPTYVLSCWQVLLSGIYKGSELKRGTSSCCRHVLSCWFWKKEVAPRGSVGQWVYLTSPTTSPSLSLTSRAPGPGPSHTLSLPLVSLDPQQHWGCSVLRPICPPVPSESHPCFCVHLVVTASRWSPAYLHALHTQHRLCPNRPAGSLSPPAPSPRPPGPAHMLPSPVRMSGPEVAPAIMSLAPVHHITVPYALNRHSSYLIKCFKFPSAITGSML